MKKTTTILGLLCLALALNAQITLEHTFTTKTSYVELTNNSTIFRYSSGDVYYTHFDEETGKATLYKSDFSVYKTVTITVPSGYTFYRISYVSDKLFNTDDAIEFAIFCYKSEPGKLIYSCKIYNENGTVLKDLGNRYAYPFIIDGKYKLLAYTPYSDDNGNYITDIYSLPGDNTSVSKAMVTEAEAAYPNPATSTITLPYSLPGGQTAEMNIYNAGGQLVEKKVIDSNFDRVLLNVGSYHPGVYIYEYNGLSSRFMVY